MGATRYFAIVREEALQRVETLAEALAAREQGGLLWIDLADPTFDALNALVEPLGLHPLAIADCLDEDQVPKMDEFPGHTFILFNRYRYVDDVAHVEETNFFLGERFLVTVHSHGLGATPLGDHLEATVRRDLEQARKGPDFLLQVLLDDIVDEKFGAIEALQDQLDAAEDELLRTPTEFRPARLIQLRRTLLRLRKSLVYEREILVKLCRRDSPYVTQDAIYDFRDIYDHLAKFFEVVEICRELIASVMEIHLAMINNQMTLTANKTNSVVRRLTMITTVFMPLTLLAGIGGMSEWSMMTGPHNWPLAYPAFVVLLAVIGAASYCLLRLADARDRPTKAVYFRDDASDDVGVSPLPPGEPPTRSAATKGGL